MLKTKSGPDVPSIARHALSSILVLAIAALVSAACTVPAYGDDDKKPDPKAANPAATDTQPAPSDHQVIQLLTQQIQQLQARVKQLEEKDAAPTPATASSAPPPAPTSVATSTAPPTIAAA